MLELLIKKDNDKITAINMNSTDYKASLEGDKLTYVEFYDSNGELIGSYSNDDLNGNYGWKSYPTKAETARQKEFISAYNEAWKATNTPKHLEGGTAIDAYA